MTNEIRILLLFAFIFLAVAYDFIRHGKKGQRWRSYLFLICGGLFGSLVGATNDAICFNLSPDYFRCMKGLYSQSESIWLGAQAGFGVGIWVAGFFLISNFIFNKSRPSQNPRSLLKYWLFPLGLALIFAVVGFWFFPNFQIAKWWGRIDDFGLEGEAALGFERVWGIICGLYLGALIGLIIGCTLIWKRRIVSNPEPHTDRSDQ